MIGRLRGTLVEVDEVLALIDVSGVGYEVELTSAARSQLPAPGEPLRLCTQLIVREDAQLLFGFADAAERELFRLLIRVSGVGPKMAMAMLSGMTAADFQQAVASDDVTRLTRLPGVGRKTAQRLVVELRDKLGELPLLASQRSESTPVSHPRQQVADAESALIALGYRPADASRAVAAVFDAGLPTNELVRLALKSLAPVE